MDKKTENRRKAFVKHTLRRASLRWPARNEALKRARVDRGLYQCAMCMTALGRDKIHLDHTAPVVDPAMGFTTWDDYINRLLPDEDGFQVLCVTCHGSKTMLEDAMRRNYTEMERAKDREVKIREKERKKNEKLLKKLDSKKNKG